MVPPYLPPDQMAQLHSALDRAVSNPELLNDLDDPGTPEMDPPGLQELEAELDAVLQEAAAKPAAKPAADPEGSDLSWTTHTSDSFDSSRTLYLPGRDDLPRGSDTC